MRDIFKTRFSDRWLWLCPVLSIVLAAAVLMVLGFTFWGGLLAALLLVCPATLAWGAITLFIDERRQRAAKKKNPNG